MLRERLLLSLRSVIGSPNAFAASSFVASRTAFSTASRRANFHHCGNAPTTTTRLLEGQSVTRPNRPQQRVTIVLVGEKRGDVLIVQGRRFTEHHESDPAE